MRSEKHQGTREVMFFGTSGGSATKDRWGGGNRTGFRDVLDKYIVCGLSMRLGTII